MKKEVWGIIGVAVLLVVVFFVLMFDLGRQSEPIVVSISNFDECVQAGNPVAESFPRQCRTADGQLFIEPLSNPTATSTIAATTTPATPNTPGPVAAGCRPTGCSSQICSDQDVASTCEYREEYACYRTAKCERQTDGKCGWTQTPALAQCLIQARHATE